MALVQPAIIVLLEQLIHDSVPQELSHLLLEILLLVTVLLVLPDLIVRLLDWQLFKGLVQLAITVLQELKRNTQQHFAQQVKNVLQAQHHLKNVLLVHTKTLKEQDTVILVQLDSHVLKELAHLELLSLQSMNALLETTVLQVQVHQLNVLLEPITQRLNVKH